MVVFRFERGVMKGKMEIIFITMLLILLSFPLFAEITVDILSPVAEGESQETVTMILEAVTAGLEQAGAGLGKGDMQLRTWFRREQGFYQVKLELSSNDGVYALQERYPVGDLPALRIGLTALAKQVAAEKAAADKAAADKVAAEKAVRRAALQAILDKRNLVRVEGGTFRMGSTSGESDEKPVHKVKVSSFYISKYEVTQGEYKAVMGNNPSDTSKGIGENYPVNNVSWYDAVEYCNKLSLKDGLTPAYSGSGNNIRMNINANGYRLPTEAEWEYAARGGSSSRGYTYSGSNTIGSVAWYSSNSGSKTHSVGGKQANELGLYDMSGNVWEWCWDWYGDYSSSSQTDPTGKSSGSLRVFRGGGWSGGAAYCRSAYRLNDIPVDSFIAFGFRLVRRP